MTLFKLKTVLSKDFTQLSYSRFFFTLAVQMQAVVMGWRMYDLTHDPLALGFIGLAEAIPALGLAMYAGFIVDHSRPTKVFRGVLAGSLFSALILFASAVWSGHLSVQAQVILLYASSVCTGASRAFSQPSVFAIVPKIVAREQWSKATAWMTSFSQIARISGPALGGILFGFFGMRFTFALICVLLVVSAAFASQLRANIAPARKMSESDALWRELLVGLKFVVQHKILFPAMALDMVSVLFGGVTALLPIYASEILLTGPKGLGILRAAPAMGAVLTSLWLTRVQLRKSAGTWLLSSVAGFGVSILIFAVTKNFFIALTALAASGAFDSISMVVRGAAVQLASPDHMRGRISAVNSMFIGSSNELGEFESGLTARVMGTVPAATFGAVMCLATVAGAALFSPRLRKLNLDKISS